MAIKNKYKIIYYANDNSFYNKLIKVNIHDGWYNDKDIYNNIDDLIKAIKIK